MKKFCWQIDCIRRFVNDPLWSFTSKSSGIFPSLRGRSVKVGDVAGAVQGDE